MILNKIINQDNKQIKTIKVILMNQISNEMIYITTKMK